MNDRPDFDNIERLTAEVAMEVHTLMVARGCDDYTIVGVTAAIMHDALQRLPQHAARKTFSALITTMLEELGFENGRRMPP
jgi:hypothetical protein